MKKGIRRILLILLLLLAAAAAFAFSQRENLMALRQGLQMTSEQIEQALTENREQLRQSVEANADVSVRTMTEEEKQALRDGSMTREEIIESMVTPQDGSAAAAEEKDSYSHDLSLLIAEAYVLREEYTNEIEAMAQTGRDEYNALTAEGKSKAELVKWAGGYVTRAGTLEKECDARMNELLVRLEALLKDHGESDALAEQVIEAYAGEKRLTKSWYLSELEKRGLLG